MARGSTTRGARIVRRILAPSALLPALWLAALPACTDSSRDRSADPAYMCPRLLERCRECRKRLAGFDEWDCNGSDGEVLERCKGKAAARPPWLDKLGAALDQDTCREFEDGL
jgi:hypothetical protein